MNNSNNIKIFHNYKLKDNFGRTLIRCYKNVIDLKLLETMETYFLQNELETITTKIDDCRGNHLSSFLKYWTPRGDSNFDEIYHTLLLQMEQ